MAVPILRANDVHVWWRRADGITAEPFERAYDTLSPDERLRCERFRSAEDRRAYALAHDLLRRSLSRYSPTPPQHWRFITGENGKPRLSPDTLSFNLTHSRHAVACAVSSGLPVGIDLERIDCHLDVEPLATRFFHAAEIAALRRQADPVTRFFELWTLKEAFLKAAGCGLSQPLGTFSFALTNDERIEFRAPPGFDAAQWQFTLYAPGNDVRLAVAACAPAQAVRWSAWETGLGSNEQFTPVRASSAR